MTTTRLSADHEAAPTRRVLSIGLAVVLTIGTAAAQKQPAPGDPNRTLQMFDVRDLVGALPARATGIAKGKAKSKAKGRSVAQADRAIDSNPQSAVPPRWRAAAVASNGKRSPGFTARRLNSEDLVAFVRGFITGTLDEGDEIKSIGHGNLIALAGAEKLAWISRFLRVNREKSAEPVKLQMRMMSMPKKAFEAVVKPILESKGQSVTIVDDPQMPPAKQSLTGRTGPLINLINPPGDEASIENKYALLPDAKAVAALRAGLTKEGVEVVSLPALETLPLTSTGLHIGKKISYVKDFDVELSGMTATATPIVGVLRDGIEFGCTIARLEQDRIGIEFGFANSEVALPMKKITTRLVEGGAPVTIQLPELRISRLCSRVELRPGHTALFAMRQANGTYLALLLTTKTN